jgi:inosine/xanthosine triphosphate pyrophosphatase family protein
MNRPSKVPRTMSGSELDNKQCIDPCYGFLAYTVPHTLNGRHIDAQTKFITGNPHTDSRGNKGALDTLKDMFYGTLQSNTQCVSISIITECDKDDVAWKIIASTALDIAINRFPGLNVVIKMVDNPYKVRDAASVPIQTAKALYDGLVNYLSSQNHMFSLCATNAFFALSISYDFRGKTCTEDQRYTTTAYPGNIMYHIESSDTTPRFVGGELTEIIASPNAGNSGYIVAAAYGATQKPITLDSDRKVVSQPPSVKFAYSDNVKVSNTGNFSVFPDTYHGVCMGHTHTNNTGIVKISDGEFMFSPDSAVYKCLQRAISEIVLPDRHTISIGMLTSNRNKANEVDKFTKFIFERLNREYHGVLNKFNVNVQQINFLSMAEGQYLDPVECTRNKLNGTRLSESQITALLGLRAVMLDDTSFFVEALNMQPGPYYKGYYDEYNEKKATRGDSYGYNNFICDAVNKFVADMTATTRRDKGREPTLDEILEWRAAHAVTVFACYIATPWSTVYDVIVASKITGIIPESPRGSREFGWDTIFEFLEIENDMGEKVKTSGRTYADNTDEQNALCKPRAEALKKLLINLFLIMKGQDFKPDFFDLGMSVDEQKHSIESMKECIATFNALLSAGQISVSGSTNSTVSNSKARGDDGLRLIFDTL